jgi:hypothetical protein
VIHSGAKAAAQLGAKKLKEMSMEQLSQEQMNQVEGGMELVDAAAMITSLSLYSPITMAFGLPIAGALITLDVLSDG